MYALWVYIQAGHDNFYYRLQLRQIFNEDENA